MSRYSNNQVITSIQNGEEEVLFYIAGKYFQSARRWLRRNGFRDRDTPTIFSELSVSIYREIQQSNISPSIDFEQYFFSSLKVLGREIKKRHEISPHAEIEGEMATVGSCYSIMDETSRKILAARYIDKMSFEQIAASMNFSNPMIAEFEFNKAFAQYEMISRARLNVSQ